ncbi:hypothetical protein PFICI_01552 [Pestalotiopsis fici W106-1]|uniref:Uncharacterized protein n=1 Tax=Pestalotiopsis fici (strain W106-1 / CGMCC3.15140) TaxID=1229662 RepID=W3XP34_PESFW|nr:uncharacterized protein PFICI_01552 [Pestalotiopsis fici W106-1]ETS87724.1 hypothetical protein PFICI_01552 [Pestalotiopsis fici W106-1]
MWDRFRPLKDGLSASQSDRKNKLNVQQEWQTPRAPSPYGYSIKIQGGPAPPRPPRDFEHSSPLQTSAPAVQAVRQNPPPRTGLEPYRNSEYGRPVSSIYSQPSPAAATFAAEQLRGDVYSAPHEISPPSSPDDVAPRNGTHSYGGGDVSPIEDTENRLYIMNNPPAEPSANQSRSNIPQMRRERRKNSVGAMFQSREMNSPERQKQYRPHGKDVRWDPRTGEPTVGEKGRPSQIDPHNYVQRLATANAPTGAPQRTGQQPVNPFGVRLKPAQQRTRPGLPAEQTPRSNPKAEAAPRPEWRGGSGRTATVDPVADDRSVAPLHIPRRSSKRTPRDPGVLSPVSPGGSETTSPPPTRTAPERLDDNRSKAMNVRITAPSSQQEKSRVDASSYPSPPLSDDQSAPAKVSQAPRSQQQASTSTQPQQKQTLLQANEKAIRRKPAGGSSHNPHLSVSSSIYSQVDGHPPAPPPVDDRFQLPSRSTGNTSTTPASTVNPQSSPVGAPPLSTPTRQASESPKPIPGDSVLDRKRPVVKGYEESVRSLPSPEPIKINMGSPYYTTAPEPKPTGARPLPFSNNSALSVNTIASGDKDLPMVPPELSARDRVTFLNAQVEALGNRRININHAIKQMTELMPTDNVLASDAVIRKREQEKRKVETLRAELADVQREEYELGLKLHRAYKRLDRDAEYEPTTLWVRRVTG